jgi:hypothetical protein
MHRAAKFLLAGTVLLASAGIPAAASAAGTVNACVNESSGTIKIVSSPSDCSNHDMPLVLGSGGGAAANPPGSQVFDKKGSLVGNIDGPDIVLVQANGTWVYVLLFGPAGFQVYDPTQAVFWYTEANCGGTAYLPAYDVPPQGYIFGNPVAAATSGNLYYPLPPYQQMTIVSSGDVNHDVCYPVSPSNTATVGAAGTVTLDYAAPFAVE